MGETEFVSISRSGVLNERLGGVRRHSRSGILGVDDVGIEMNMVERRRTAKVVVASLLAFCVGAGCSSGRSTQSAEPPTTPRPPGETATWFLQQSQRLTVSSRSFTAMVTRLACNGGETGKVLPPTVRYRADQIVVTFRVEPQAAGIHTCQGNRPVGYPVRLDRPIGSEQLVDGACLGIGEAARTTGCFEPTRWPTPTVP